MLRLYITNSQALVKCDAIRKIGMLNMYVEGQSVTTVILLVGLLAALFAGALAIWDRFKNPTQKHGNPSRVKKSPIMGGVGKNNLRDKMIHSVLAGIFCLLLAYFSK